MNSYPYHSSGFLCPSGFWSPTQRHITILLQQTMFLIWLISCVTVRKQINSSLLPQHRIWQCNNTVNKGENILYYCERAIVNLNDPSTNSFPTGTTKHIDTYPHNTITCTCIIQMSLSKKKNEELTLLLSTQSFGMGLILQDLWIYTLYILRTGGKKR